MSIPPVRGAIDLAALAAQARRSEQGPPSGTIEITEQSLQEFAQRSLQVPVLIVFVAAASPASKQRLAGSLGDMFESGNRSKILTASGSSPTSDRTANEEEIQR